MSKTSIAQLVLFFVAGALWGACADPVGITCPDDPLNCGCRGPCQEGQYCVEGTCVGGSSDGNCGPTGEACGAGYTCDQGACVCDDRARVDDPRACGCPAVDCGEGRCVGGVCMCDPAKHRLDQHACGCNPEPIDCDEMGPGNTCLDGVCTCNWPDHLNDSSNCRCLGACADDKVCQSGRCTCPANTIPCGEDCIPSGSSCCDDSSGARCAPGQTCEQASAGWTCRPSSAVACYDTSYYTSFCAPGQQCSGTGCSPASWSTCADGTTTCSPGTTCDRMASGYVCRSNESTPCYSGSVLVGTCQPSQQCVVTGSSHICIDPGETFCDQANGTPHVCPAGSSCTANGCLEPGWTLCQASPERKCPPASSCFRIASGYACVDDAEIGCEVSGGAFHTCARGWSCTRNGCLPPGWSLCSLSSEVMCAPQDRCMRHEDGFYTCLHRDLAPCFNRNGAFNGLSCSGGECISCGDDWESRCAAGC